jgi:hypothetical protein
MEREPVMVIHGVNNPNEKDFNRTVARLSELLERKWELVPVWWDELGSHPQGIRDAIPPFTFGSGTRSKDGAAGLPAAIWGPGVDILNLPGPASTAETDMGSETEVRGGNAAKGIIIDAALVRITGGDAVRTPKASAQVTQAVEEAWAELKFLPLIRNRRVLEQLGALIGDTAKGSGAAVEATRAGFDPIGALKDLMRAGDRLTGAFVGVFGEKALEWSRTMVIPALAKGAGDVLVYQAHRTSIADVVRKKLATKGNDLGTSARPAKVLAHSLGGIVAFDLAVHDESPVHWSALVTFGSQSSILHVLDPRGPLDRYVPEPNYSPVKLPSTIRRWTNLFEPWDPLAFYASRVFDSESRSRIRDFEVPHRLSSGLGTHSSYWTNEDAIREMARALTVADS